MKYLEAIFRISADDSPAADILATLCSEAGFEAFEETDEGLCGYVQQDLFDGEALKRIIEEFPIEGVSITYEIREAPYQDWNAEWEAEGFQPIIIGDRLAVHDGRHLPPHTALTIEIDARMAFGTGTHETTRLMLSRLMTIDLWGRRILDEGTGTGILAIAALKLGAREAVAFDIDEWSVDNARHNAIINCVEASLKVMQADCHKALKQIEGLFDVIMANINRNIILQDLPLLAGCLAPGGSLLLSGFYAQDVPIIEAKSLSLGLSLAPKATPDAHTSPSSWVSLEFRVPKA